MELGKMSDVKVSQIKNFGKRKRVLYSKSKNPLRGRPKK